MDRNIGSKNDEENFGKLRLSLSMFLFRTRSSIKEPNNYPKLSANS